MKFIIEIPAEPASAVADATDAEALLIGRAEGFTSAPLPRALPHPPIYQRITGGDFEFEGGSEHAAGFAIDLADGQPDLDRASAILRVEEAKTGRGDRITSLIAFLFPDLASLADRGHGLVGSPRLFALAYDEARMQSQLPSGEPLHPAPLVYARARSVGEARKLACPVYLKPLWSGDNAQNRAIIAQAKADGFDGLISPPAMAALIRNA